MLNRARESLPIALLAFVDWASFLGIHNGRVNDDNQTFVPESFTALYSDARQRLTASRTTIAARHELCDDMANMLTEHCRAIHFRDGIDEVEVLRRVHLGLLAPPVTIESFEAEWVVRRTAELLDWPDPFQAAESGREKR